MNWQYIYTVSGLDCLATGVVKISLEFKRLQLENKRLKELFADKEFEIKIKNEFYKKKHYTN
jgi:hypothetical protein